MRFGKIKCACVSSYWPKLWSISNEVVAAMIKVANRRKFQKLDGDADGEAGGEAAGVAAWPVEAAILDSQRAQSADIRPTVGRRILNIRARNAAAKSMPTVGGTSHGAPVHAYSEVMSSANDWPAEEQAMSEPQQPPLSDRKATFAQKFVQVRLAGAMLRRAAHAGKSSIAMGTLSSSKPVPSSAVNVKQEISSAVSVKKEIQPQPGQNSRITTTGRITALATALTTATTDATSGGCYAKAAAAIRPSIRPSRSSNNSNSCC
jgi:hypothetical protein